jgi:hypothetical protein
MKTFEAVIRYYATYSKDDGSVIEKEPVGSFAHIFQASSRETAEELLSDFTRTLVAPRAPTYIRTMPFRYLEIDFLFQERGSAPSLEGWYDEFIRYAREGARTLIKLEVHPVVRVREPGGGENARTLKTPKFIAFRPRYVTSVRVGFALEVDEPTPVSKTNMKGFHIETLAGFTLADEAGGGTYAVRGSTLESLLELFEKSE